MFSKFTVWDVFELRKKYRTTRLQTYLHQAKRKVRCRSNSGVKAASKPAWPQSDMETIQEFGGTHKKKQINMQRHGPEQ
jgi:hypothetical protein